MSAPRFFSFLLISTIFLATLGAAFFFIFLRPGTITHIPETKVASVHKRAPQILYEEPLPAELPRVLVPLHLKQRHEKGQKAKIAIIIDDIGYKKKIGEQLLDLDLNLTFSFLPFGPFTAVQAKKARALGRDVLLHMPMEATGAQWDPGPGTLFTSMSHDQIEEIFNNDLAAVPMAMGVNNHMGSRFTEDTKGMNYLLALLKKRGLFFVDSLTSAKSVGYDLAGKKGVKRARRSVFLDNEHDTEKIKRQLDQLMRLASKHGSAIGIGHPHPETVAALREYQARLRGSVNLVPVHDLVR